MRKNPLLFAQNANEWRTAVSLTVVDTLNAQFGIAQRFVEEILRAHGLTPTGKTRRRRLRTPEHVVRAIEQITQELAEGTADPQLARTRLYALQTLLVALRMTHPALEGKPRKELPAPTVEAE